MYPAMALMIIIDDIEVCTGPNSHVPRDKKTLIILYCCLLYHVVVPTWLFNLQHGENDDFKW